MHFSETEVPMFKKPTRTLQIKPYPTELKKKPTTQFNIFLHIHVQNSSVQVE